MERIQNMIYRIQALICSLVLRIKHVKLGTNVKYNGWINVRGRGENIIIGNNTIINSGKYKIPVGYPQSCSFWSIGDGVIEIGEGCGISNATICSNSRVSIGNHVLLGAGTKIYDTDFHSLDYIKRRSIDGDDDRRTKPICIGDDVFIGGGSTVLKGVKIGEKSIVGACSVVCCDIPAREIWGGAPARFIRTVSEGVFYDDKKSDKEKNPE